MLAAQAGDLVLSPGSTSGKRPGPRGLSSDLGAAWRAHTLRASKAGLALVIPAFQRLRLSLSYSTVSQNKPCVKSLKSTPALYAGCKGPLGAGSGMIPCPWPPRLAFRHIPSSPSRPALHPWPRGDGNIPSLPELGQEPEGQDWSAPSVRTSSPGFYWVTSSHHAPSGEQTGG